MPRLIKECLFVAFQFLENYDNTTRVETKKPPKSG